MRLVKSMLLSVALTLVVVGGFSVHFSAPTLAAPCNATTFFGLPTWYKYLNTESVIDGVTGGQTCNVQLEGIGDVWLVVAAVIEILLRVAALVAIGFIIYGGVSYVISQGAPDKTKQALMTIINALIGLAISVVATALVSFIASRFK